MPSSGANNTSPFVSGDVAFRSREFTGAITNDWTTVPWCATDFAPYGDKNADHLSRAHTPSNIALGIGDICRYMGVVDGSRWRIPTAAEIAKLYGSDQIDGGQSVVLGNEWIAGNYYPLHGRAFGAGRDYVTIDGNNAEARVINADAWINGAVFLPASGRRDYTNGASWYIGSNGYCWASTAAEIDKGYYMYFYSSSVVPQNPVLRTYARSIRCIRE